MKEFLERLSNKQSLTKEEMTAAINLMVGDEVSESEIAAFLFGLKMKGETVDEVVGIVEAIRANIEQFENAPFGSMDNCGTGGDNSNTFNISTTTSFVLAGAGIPIAKHGNRSITSKTGSADVLEELGVNLLLSAEEATTLLNEIGITFLFAPHLHKSFQRVAKIRKKLKVPTIFNLIGPLTNPIQLDYQMIGMYRRDLLKMFAQVLNELGRKRAVLLNGTNYIDELSLAGDNYLVILEDGQIREEVINGKDYNLPTVENDLIKGGDAHYNSKILRSVLEAVESPYYYTILLNAGVGIYASGKVKTIEEGIISAEETIKSGRALEKLQLLIEKSSSFKMGVQ